MHKPYNEILKHNCDFKVNYKFFDESEGGRKTLPHQSIRSDFWYEHPDHAEKTDWLFMIWPEFEDSNENLIESSEVAKEGIARMWIINPEMRKYHQDRISIGLTGFLKRVQN
ncbi:MAG: hypothetical protein ABFS35_17290 [Bacteroidota bacterium]